MASANATPDSNPDTKKTATEAVKVVLPVPPAECARVGVNCVMSRAPCELKRAEKLAPVGAIHQAFTCVY